MARHGSNWPILSLPLHRGWRRSFAPSGMARKRKWPLGQRQDLFFSYDTHPCHALSFFDAVGCMPSSVPEAIPHSAPLLPQSHERCGLLIAGN
jgi:hypothetical protein